MSLEQLMGIMQFLESTKFYRSELNAKNSDRTLKAGVKVLTKVNKKFMALSDGFRNWLKIFSIGNISLIVQLALLIGICMISYTMLKKLFAKLMRIELQLRMFSDNSEQFGTILNRIKSNVHSHQHETRHFGQQFQTAEEKVARSLNAAVTILDLKGERNFEIITNVLESMKESVDGQHQETKIKFEEVISLMKSIEEELQNRVERLESSTVKPKGNTHGMPSFHTDKGLDRNTSRIEKCIASAIKKSLSEVHNLEFRQYVDNRIKEELRIFEDRIKDEIYKSSFALKEVVDEGHRMSSRLCQKLMKYLATVNDESLRKILTTTDQIKYCLNYLHENQTFCSQDIVTQLMKILDEKFPRRKIMK